MLTGDLWVTTLRLNEFATTGGAKLVGFNSPGCFVDPYPDSELPFDAAKAFANTGGCIEIKPRRKV